MSKPRKLNGVFMIVDVYLLLISMMVIREGFGAMIQ